MMCPDFRSSDFADFRSIFERALELVGRGMAVGDSLEEALRAHYPHTHAEIRPRLMGIFDSVKKAKGWGDLRTLRELASGMPLPQTETAEEGEEAIPSLGVAVADLKRVYGCAYRKFQAGFKAENALEMACTELYPLIHRKVLRAAEERLRHCIERERLSVPAALKRLSGDEA
jgi:hypothetical protein